MTQIYDTAIRLSLVEHGVLRGISSIVALLARGTGEVKKFESALGNLKWAAWGAAGIFAGWEAFKGLKHLADDAKELSHQLANIQKLGLTQAQVAAATGAAFALPGQVPGTVSSGGLQILSNINSIVGPEGARKMLGPLAQFGQAMGAQSGDYDKANDNILKLVRSGDLLGKFVDSATRKVDLNRLQSFLDLVAKVSAATHGMVGPATWLAMAQQGGPALSSMSDEGLMSMAMAAQAMGGFRSGTAMTSLYQQMIGGKMTQYAAQELSGMGLVGKNFEVTKGGHLVWGKGALDTKFTQALQKDPLKAEVIMREAMEKAGFTSIETQIPELFKMIGRQTTQRLLHDFMRNEPQMFGERGRMMKGEGVAGQLRIANATDYERNMHNLTAAWSDMMAKIGLPITQAAIPVMQKITDAFLKIGTLATLHPDAIGHIAEGIAALGLALMGGGGVAILSALGPAGWLAAGIIAAGVAMAAYKNPIEAWLESIRKINWNEEITKALEPAIIAIKAWFSNLGTAIIDSLKGMWENMKGALGNLFHASYGGDGPGGGSGIGATKAAWSGGGGGVGGTRGFTGDAGGMQPYFKTRLDSLLADANASGHPLSVASGYRSQAHQNALFAASDHSGHWVARHSHHTMGIAADLRGDLAWAHAHAAQHGLRFPMPWEKWHIEPSGRPPAHLPSSRQGTQVNVHNVMTLDGKVIATSVSKHFVRSAQYPTSIGRQDGRGVFQGPGSEVFA